MRAMSESIYLLLAGIISFGIFLIVVKRLSNIANLCFAGWSLLVVALSLYSLIKRDFTYFKPILGLYVGLISMIAYNSFRTIDMSSKEIMAMAKVLLLISGVGSLIVSILSFLGFLK